MERKSKWKMEMTGDRGRDNDDGDGDGDLAVCLEIILPLPAIRLQTTAAEHKVSQCNEINERMCITISYGKRIESLCIVF